MAEIQKVLAMGPAAQAGRLDWVSRRQALPAAAVPAAVVPAAQVVLEGRPVILKVRRGHSTG